MKRPGGRPGHPADATTARTLGAWLRRGVDALRRDRLLQVLLVALGGLALWSPGQIARYPSLVEWPTIGALTGLLVLTQALAQSGGLRRLGQALLQRLHTERAAALSLVTAAALLSMLLTNDVALFVVVPLTLGLCRDSSLPATRLIIFEALAVNAGSALTPIGNPQNLFVWQQSGLGFAAFVAQMAPLVAALSALLLLATAAAFSGRALHAAAPQAPQAPPALDRRLLFSALVLYLPFLAAAELHRVGWALAVVVAAIGVQRRAVLARLDWGLLAVFVLMFIDLRLLVELPAVHRFVAQIGLAQPQHLYFTAIAASQLVSNVPAVIALAEYSKDWRVLAYGVNVGGFGFVLGSMANLIALRMAKDGRAWISFHFYAVPALALAAAIGWVLLFVATGS
jgi:di/tricarboxylate transporter